MQLLALGLNHDTAPVALRERVAFAPERLDEALDSLADDVQIAEAAILSTCNRTEIYCRQGDIPAAALVDWISRYRGVPGDSLRDCLYEHPGERAVRHAFRVASGLDSMVLGEPQILGQMKDAFVAAHRAGATGKVLNRLFQHTFAVAKQVRTDTSIGASAVSVAYAAVTLARRLFGDMASQRVILIGAGETAELTARHLRHCGVREMIVVNRTLSRAQTLAGEFGASAIGLDELPARLPEGDIVVTSTASTLPILGKGLVERALRARRNRPMFVVDLAVPRDVEPEVGDLRNIFLYTVDDLRDVVETNVESRREAAVEAEKIIELQTDRFMRWLRSLDSVPTIRAVREGVQQVGDAELERALRRMRAGDDPESVLRQLTRALGNKLTHAPSVALKQAEADGDPELARAARKLFGLDDASS